MNLKALARAHILFILLGLKTMAAGPHTSENKIKSYHYTIKSTRVILQNGSEIYLQPSLVAKIRENQFFAKVSFVLQHQVAQGVLAISVLGTALKKEDIPPEQLRSDVQFFPIINRPNLREMILMAKNINLDAVLVEHSLAPLFQEKNVRPLEEMLGIRTIEGQAMPHFSLDLETWKNFVTSLKKLSPMDAYREFSSLLETSEVLAPHPFELNKIQEELHSSQLQQMALEYLAWVLKGKKCYLAHKIMDFLPHLSASLGADFGIDIKNNLLFAYSLAYPIKNWNCSFSKHHKFIKWLQSDLPPTNNFATGHRENARHYGMTEEDPMYNDPNSLYFDHESAGIASLGEIEKYEVKVFFGSNYFSYRWFRLHGELYPNELNADDVLDLFAKRFE